MWACIVAQVLLLLALLVWLWLSADPNCCSFSDRNLNRFSAGVVDAGVDGVAVDDDAGVARVWWMLSWKKQIERLKCLFFTLYVTIFVLKSFSFQLLLSLVWWHYRLFYWQQVLFYFWQIFLILFGFFAVYFPNLISVYSFNNFQLRVFILTT